MNEPRELYICFIILVSRIKLMVVPDAYRRINLQGFQQVVVDNRTGIEDIARDVELGHMTVVNADLILLLLGRANFLNNVTLTVVLERLSAALTRAGFSGRVVTTGPMPASHDSASWCRQMRRERQAAQERWRGSNSVCVSSAADVLSDEHGVIPQLLDHQGLTLNGVQEISSRLNRIS